jgi:hypothetical protein
VSGDLQVKKYFYEIAKFIDLFTTLVVNWISEAGWGMIPLPQKQELGLRKVK